MRTTVVLVVLALLAGCGDGRVSAESYSPPPREALSLSALRQPGDWTQVRALAVEERFYDAAKLATRLLYSESEREARMWTWWDEQFKARPDAQPFTWAMGVGFAQVYENGDVFVREVVCEIFGREVLLAGMTPEEFREEVGLTEANRQRQKP